MIEEIVINNKLMAIIVSHRFNEPGIHFFTPNDSSQQLGYMNHPKGKIIAPHVHNSVPRNVDFTKEVLIIKKGKLRVDFYDANQTYFESRILQDGDIVVLSEGGHGFEVLESVEMYEVKQGPYVGEADKTRFSGISKDKIVLPAK